MRSQHWPLPGPAVLPEAPGTCVTRAPSFSAAKYEYEQLCGTDPDHMFLCSPVHLPNADLMVSVSGKQVSRLLSANGFHGGAVLGRGHAVSQPCV